MYKFNAKLFLLKIPFCFLILSTAEAKFPKPTGWVNDYAQVIDANTKTTLETLLTELEQKTQAEIAVVTLQQLAQNEDIELTAVEMFAEW
ncbi:MAG: TPM domain-containing protein, partial [Elusimicrobiota bacterium]|nr:TPM domain-containing protein [Elusimicrobiota bacterium]